MEKDNSFNILFFSSLVALSLMVTTSNPTENIVEDSTSIPEEIIKEEIVEQVVEQIIINNNEISPTLIPTMKPTIKPKIVTLIPTIKVKSIIPIVETVKQVIPSTDSYICNYSKTCPQMSSCAETQYQLNICGYTRRDGDNDRIACDSDSVKTIISYLNSIV